MTKNKLFIISVILLVLSIAIPIGLSCRDEGALHVVDSVSALLGAFCGVIMLLIAILLYNKYGVDRSITDKNLKVVLDIVEELKKTTVIAWSDSKSGAYLCQLNFWNTNLSEFGQGSVHNILDDTVYFKISYAYAFDRLFELGRDPFTPKEISEAIKGIQLVTLSEVKKEDMAERKAVLYVKMDEPVEYGEMVGKFNNRDMTLRQYTQNYLKVRESIKTWLIAHNVDANSLNF